MASNNEVVGSSTESSTVESPAVKKSTTQTLNTLIPEIRDRIIDFVLADPQKPDFEASIPSRKYPHYLALLFTTKNLNSGVRDALARAQDLVIVTSNHVSLPFLLFAHGIPIISDHEVHKMRCHVMKIYIKHPGDHDSVINCFLMRKDDLPDLAKVLRNLSLCWQHVPRLPRICWRNGLPFTPRLSAANIHMTLRLRFTSEPFGKDLTTADKTSLLESLHLTNRTGRIEIKGLGADSALVSMLPGHSEVFRDFDPNGNETTVDYIKNLKETFVSNREVDRFTYMEMLRWLLRLIIEAIERGAIQLAMHRSILADRLATSAMERNPMALRGSFANLLEFDMLFLKVRLNLAEIQHDFGLHKKALINLNSVRSSPTFRLMPTLEALLVLEEDENRVVEVFRDKWSVQDVDREYSEQYLTKEELAMTQLARAQWKLAGKQLVRERLARERKARGKKARDENERIGMGNRHRSRRQALSNQIR